MDNEQSKEQSLEILNKKNTLAIYQQVKFLEELVSKQQERINGLISSIHTLNNRLDNLEKMNLSLKVKMTGTGPSVKE